ncbi:hypothetical protein QG37_00154 [Candidozyma auris]|nr:hypothetical protein QG37_00154 [[Candida] auris]
MKRREQKGKNEEKGGRKEGRKKMKGREEGRKKKGGTDVKYSIQLKRPGSDNG